MSTDYERGLLAGRQEFARSLLPWIKSLEGTGVLEQSPGLAKIFAAVLLASEHDSEAVQDPVPTEAAPKGGTPEPAAYTGRHCVVCGARSLGDDVCTRECNLARMEPGWKPPECAPEPPAAPLPASEAQAAWERWEAEREAAGRYVGTYETWMAGWQASRAAAARLAPAAPQGAGPDLTPAEAGIAIDTLTGDEPREVVP